VVALFPLLLLFCKFFVIITVVTGLIADVPSPGVMQRPRSPRAAACSRADCSSVVSPNPAGPCTT
jgi:Ca2+-transporting ATPase